MILNAATRDVAAVQGVFTDSKLGTRIGRFRMCLRLLAVAACCAGVFFALEAGSAQAYLHDCENRQFSLRSTYNGRYVSAELDRTDGTYGMLRARAQTAGLWERFRMVCLAGGQFAMRSVANGMYVSAELDYTGRGYGMLRARTPMTTGISTWERFNPLWTLKFSYGDRRFDIQSAANGLVASVEVDYPGADYGMLRARTPETTLPVFTAPWELLELEWLPCTGC